MSLLHPDLPARLNELIAGMESIDVSAEFLRALNFKWEGPSRTYNLGIVQRDGMVWTDTAGNTPPLDLSHRYIEELASALGGRVEKAKNGKWYVTIGGGAPKIEHVMDRFGAWVGVARDHVERLQRFEGAD